MWLQVPLSCTYRNAKITQGLAQKITADTVLDGITLSRVDAVAHVMDSHLELRALQAEDGEVKHIFRRRILHTYLLSLTAQLIVAITQANKPDTPYLFGEFSVDTLVSKLGKYGIAEYRIERVNTRESDWVCMVHVGTEARVYLGPSTTHIETSNEKLRRVLGDVVVECLMPL